VIPCFSFVKPIRSTCGCGEAPEPLPVRGRFTRPVSVYADYFSASMFFVCSGIISGALSVTENIFTFSFPTFYDNLAFISEMSNEFGIV
jgi:hypothetical protein